MHVPKQIKGLLLQYGYCEEMRFGVDPWVSMDGHFTNLWDALQNLASVLYFVWREESPSRSSGACCKQWLDRKNIDVYSKEALDASGLVGSEALRYCVKCSNLLCPEEFRYEEFQIWLRDEYESNPGAGAYGGLLEDYEEHWARDTCLEWIIDPEMVGGWVTVGHADLVLALAVPEVDIPESSRDAYREDFDHYFDTFDKEIREAFKAKGGK